MAQGFDFDQVQQIHHMARLAVLAMSARGVCASEFEENPEVQKVVVTVTRSNVPGDLPVDFEFFGSDPFPIGGMSI